MINNFWLSAICIGDILGCITLGMCKAFNVLGDKVSSSSSLEYGVPQGSIFGPLIFKIFVNDSANVLTFSMLDMYAGDMTPYVTGKSVSEVQSKLEKDLYHIVKWCDRNELIIDIDKSNCLIICTSQKRRHLDIL